ncbi:MAG: hypothetical protein JST11_30405 [Acidobacteria bacterium]|nr:hypothetical protein [Acidobacteriota bacterium]
MLRYAVLKAAGGAVITFDVSLRHKVIQLDRGSPNNHIAIDRDVTIEGPGPDLLTISGGNATRIFFISGGVVQLSGFTLAEGAARGGAGGPATGGAGGGGGAAGLGGAIFLQNGTLVLNAIVFSRNRAFGGNGGAPGTTVNAGRGGGGGGFGGNSVEPGIGGPGGALNAAGEPRGGAGGSGGMGGSSAGAGGEGGWGGGGGGGGVGFADGVGRGATGGPSGFAGGVGGAGGYFNAETGDEVPGGGGCGGSALGGALFATSGLLHLNDTLFLDNSSVAGLGASGAVNGVAKGGALFLCSSSYCGPGHDAIAVLSGNTVFKANSASDAGVDQTCTGRDDADVCGPITIAPKKEDSR